MSAPAGMVDWDLAVATATRLLSAGPEVSRSEADAAVGSLRQLTDVAVDHVQEITRLEATGPVPPTRVVDRPAWVRVNADSMATLLTPVVAKLEQRRPHPPGRIGQAIGPRATGLQAGGVLAFMAGKVLGQFEFFSREGGQLLLVAPNVVEAERSLGVDPRDFRLWVCLHEVTHRLQFTAVPWLRGHLVDEINALVDATDLDPEALRERLATVARELGRVVRGEREQSDGILGLVQSPAQREVINRLTAFMSLVEGHAEWVMNAVGTDVVPTLPTIRDRFGRRRQGAGPLDRLLRRLLGLDVKLRQYADGSKFVRAVVDSVGVDAFNAVWSSAQTLPRRAELAAPMDWVERVHGFRPAASA
ncbi:MAG TPA: zinc-dependent metalloprotease [Mycobacteriales bacterium]|nr:zinc-dependent metalloprotease [Mycobacteriales bacterium]